MTLPAIQVQSLLLTAWEASCERLRNVTNQRPGLPPQSIEEIQATFALVAENLAALRIAFAVPDSTPLPQAILDPVMGLISLE